MSLGGRAPRSSEILIPAGLTLLSGIAILLFRSLFHLWGPLGSDAILWLFSSYNLDVGAPSLVPPLYPALLLLSSVLPVMDATSAGLILSALSLMLVPPLAFILGRRLGVDTLSSFAAAIVVLLSVDSLSFALHLQPDATTTLALLLVPLILYVHLERPSRTSASLLAVLIGFLPLLREHGMLLSLLLMPALLRSPLPLRERLLSLGLATTLWLSLPLLFHGHFGMPWSQPWHSRAGDALGAILAPAPGPYADRLHPDQRATLQDLHARHEIFAILLLHARHAVALDPGAWALLGLGLLGAACSGPRRALAILPILLTPLPGLLIWSQARHVLVVAPVAALGLVSGLSRLPPRCRGAARVVVISGLALLAWQWVPRWAPEGRRLEQDSARMEVLRTFGEEMCALTSPGDLVAGPFPETLLFCPRHTHEPTLDGDAADWSTWWVHSVQPASGWSLIEGLRFPVYRMRPDLKGEARPCSSSRPHGTTPFLSAPRLPAVMEPPCQSSAPYTPATNRKSGDPHPPLRGLPGRPSTLRISQEPDGS